MSNKYHKTIRKIGFGLRPEEPEPSSFNSWLNKQLDNKFEVVGVPSRFEKPISWPKEYTFSFEERLRRAYKYDDERKKIEKSKNLNGFEKKSRIKVLRKETEVDLYDVYRFWNSAIHGQDMIKQRLTHFWTNHFTVGGGGTKNYVIGDLINRVIYDNLDASFDKILYEVI